MSDRLMEARRILERLPLIAGLRHASALRRSVGVGLLLAATAGRLEAQKSSGPANGTLIVDGGGATEPVVRRFVELAGGRDARIVVFPTGASAIKFGPENIIINPDWPRDRQE